MDADLVKLLESSGFTQKEAQVYLALLELSAGTVTEIAKVTGLKRAIIYVILEGLIKRGYASGLPEQKINTYQAVDPSFILNHLKSTAKNFSEMLPMLRTLHNKGKRKPKIAYIENKDGIWKIYQEFNLAEDAFFISSYQDIEKMFPGGVENWIRDYRKGIIKVRGKHLIPNNPAEIGFGRALKSANQEVRIMENARKFKMDFTLCGNKLAITSFENDPFIVVIESEELVASMRPLFEIIWKAGKEIK